MVRFIIAIIVAAFITLGLFFLMQALIKSGGGGLQDPVQGKVLDFVRVQQEQQVQREKPKPKKPPKPQEPPPQIDQPQMEASSPDGAGGGMNFAADLGTEVSLDQGTGIEVGDGDYVPITQVQAVYPRRALQRGIQGYVLVEFTVDQTGAVRNPIVIEASPEGIFEQAALDAVVKFKYKARIINGKATAVAGVQNRITFEIE